MMNDMIRHTLMTLLVGVLIGTTARTAAAEDAYQHTTAESFAHSKYEYLWQVIQNEFDQVKIEDEADRIRHQELIDIVIRTGSIYAQPFQSTALGLRELYPELLKLNPNPPLYVQYRFHSSQAQAGYDWSDNQFEKHGRAIFQIARAMENENYPDYVIGATWLRGAEFFRDVGLADDEQALYANHRGIQTLIRGASLKDTAPEHREFVAIRIARHGWRYSALIDEHKELFCNKLLNDKDADPWVGQYAIAQLWYDRAWDSRGRGWASDVTDEQWEAFGRYLARSYAQFVNAHQTHPQWPEPAVKLISVTMGNQFDEDKDEVYWFTQATDARLDHHKAYTNLLNAYKPRWGGSIEAMVQIIGSLIDLTNQHDQMGYIVLDCLAMYSREFDNPFDLLKDEYYLGIATKLMYDELANPTPYKNKWQQRNILRTVAMGNFLTKEYEHAARLLQAGGAKTDAVYNPWKNNVPYWFEQYAPLLASQASKHAINALKELDKDSSLSAVKHLQLALDQLVKLDTPQEPELIGEDPIQTLNQLIENFK